MRVPPTVMVLLQLVGPGNPHNRIGDIGNVTPATTEHAHWQDGRLRNDAGHTYSVIDRLATAHMAPSR